MIFRAFQSDLLFDWNRFSKLVSLTNASVAVAESGTLLFHQWGGDIIMIGFFFFFNSRYNVTSLIDCFRPSRLL
jgi:hypothetical protein